MVEPPAGAKVTPLLLEAADHRQSQALWWTPAGCPLPKVAVVCMHPRVDFTRHYAFERLLEARMGCLGANTRNPNNDIDTVHEEIVLDLGACVRWLRQQGVERVVLLGNSGGGSLSALYQAQAELPAEQRIARTPAGAPTRLMHAQMPAADAMVYIAAHTGQGRILGDCIDPAVVDESDPLASRVELDMYDARNGFCVPPAWSHYDDAFVQRFREGQHARVERLDALARAHVARQRSAHQRAKVDAQTEVLRHKHFEPVMAIHRTMANLHYVDNRLDPSDRSYGSLLSERPDLMNFRLLGFARVCTPRAWLSTWSALSSNADMLQTLPNIAAPTLMVHAGRDREIYPRAHIAPLTEAIGAADRTVVTIEGARHYFEADFGEQRAPHRDELMKIVVEWIAERFAP